MPLLEVKEWLLGAITLASIIAGLIFLRFRRLTNDPLFFFFALAFFVEAASRIFMAAHVGSSEEHPIIYVPAADFLWTHRMGDRPEESQASFIKWAYIAVYRTSCSAALCGRYRRLRPPSFSGPRALWGCYPSLRTCR